MCLVYADTNVQKDVKLDVVHEWCRDVEEEVHHSNGWCTLYYRLPSHLPDFSCLTLRSMEVAAVATANPPANPVGPCLGYVGQLSFTL